MILDLAHELAVEEFKLPEKSAFCIYIDIDSRRLHSHQASARRSQLPFRAFPSISELRTLPSVLRDIARAMKYRTGRDTGGDVPPSVRLDVRDENRVNRGGDGGIGDGGGGSTSFFEPRRERTPGAHGRSGRNGGREPPEKRLTLFALRLAVLEKAASGLGKLDFVWATVVLLGGFASSLRTTDFWCVTVILLDEGARVFSRSHELEWQHHATQTDTAGGALRSSSRFLRRVVAPDGGDGNRAAQFQRRVAGFVKRRTWNAPDVSLLPYTGWVFVSRKIGRLLSWLQVLSALACVALSFMRLWTHDFGAGDGAKNKRPALLLFYTLALLEASLFLLEQAYWSWKLSFRDLLHEVSAECELGAYGPASLTRFFYDAYSRCIAGSIFDGIKMDLVAFAEDLILSDFLDEQLIGVRILQQFAGNADTLREVGASPRSIDRLVEMLNWTRPDEEEVRRCAAEVVARLAGRRQNALRVSAIPGAIESVMSLLHSTAPAASHEGASPAGRYDHLPFNLLGLLILKRLARDHDNCGKIGSTRGLLAKIIDFTQAPAALLRNPHATESQLRAVKRALQLVKMLVSATGGTGKALRQEVAGNVFSVSHLRGVLQHGRQHGELQKLAIDVLTGLAMEEHGKSAIVSTGGVVKLLLSVFAGAEDRELGAEAGEALAMLALESKAACAAILKTPAGDDVLDRLLPALQDGDARRLNATRLLRNLCAYAGPGHRDSLRAATEALPAALNATMAPESDKVLEASVGLTAEICKFVDGERFGAQLRGAGMEERAYVECLASVLQRYRYPEIRVPRMRRFVVQQVIWLMTSSSGGGYVELLREAGMERLLESVADTTSGLECYHVFSGSVGIGKHRDDFSSMVDTAIELLDGRGGSRAQE
ncbi:hypothetical protein EJB05_36496, partial [Eragrostis curvula]